MKPLPGKKVRRTRLVRTDRFVIAVDVEGIVFDSDSGEVCYGPDVVNLLRDVERHAKQGDVTWLNQHGKVYAAVEAA